jgi:hypothetical protein
MIRVKLAGLNEALVSAVCMYVDGFGRGDIAFEGKYVALSGLF